MPFKALKLSAPILQALADEGYETPTPIQSKAIPPILEGRDVLGCAQTGTGKTAAFALPIIHRLHEMPVDKSRRGPVLPRALILSPTRELAAQIGESFATYGRHANLYHTVVYGGVSQFHQVRALHRGVDVLIATPGRLIDLIEQRVVNLKEVGIFVLDEADRMLDMGFIQPIRRIASEIPSRETRQTLLFSATMPKEIMHLADSLLRDPVKVAVTPVASAAPLIEQALYMVPMRQKQSLLEKLLAEKDVARAIVFTKTKHGADRVCRKLNHDGVHAVAIHGNKAQNYRTRALDAFRSGKCRVLVATDVAARGLDVDNITHVFNYDLPMEPEAYVHRIGRTGRAGATGIAISFCDNQERDLLRGVQRLINKTIPVLPLPELPPVEHDHRSSHAYAHTPSPIDGQPSGGGGGGGGGHRGSYSSQGPRNFNSRAPSGDGAHDRVRSHASPRPYADRGERTGYPRTPAAAQGTGSEANHAATPHRGGHKSSDYGTRGGGKGSGGQQSGTSSPGGGGRVGGSGGGARSKLFRGAHRKSRGS